MHGARHISLLLFLCFSIFLLHNLVPHHHHAEIVGVPVGSDCPIAHGDHQDRKSDHGHHPIHCHAFNDIVFDKYSPAKIHPQGRAIHAGVIHGQDMILHPPAAVGPSSKDYDHIPGLASWYFVARPLRAPPVSA
jgi:hypothetical protein